jgi:hypothetical protein
MITWLRKLLTGGGLLHRMGAEEEEHTMPVYPKLSNRQLMDAKAKLPRPAYRVNLKPPQGHGALSRSPVFDRSPETGYGPAAPGHRSEAH